MPDGKVFEVGGYYMRCWAEQDPHSEQWRPIASFEKVSSFTNEDPVVPGMKHRFVVWLDTQAAAAKIAKEQGLRLIREGKVGL